MIDTIKRGLIVGLESNMDIGENYFSDHVHYCFPSTYASAALDY